MDITNYANYHLWAGKKMREIVNELTEEEFVQELANFFSFKSVRKLVVHMIEALEFSIALATEKDPDTFNQEIEAIYNYSKKKLLEQWEQTDQNYSGLLKGDLKGEITVPPFLGEEFTVNKSDFLLQYITHTTYHRGQLVIALKSHGKKITPTDYLNYLHGITAKQ
jgi:uncharacterized damage-inducible protein DinB